MRRTLLATVVGAALCATSLQPAKAWGGGGVVVGTFAGLAAGTVVGAALAHPYYPYPYPYYPYPYYYGAPVVYPAPVIAAPYPYAYSYAPPPGYVPSGYAPPAPAAAPPVSAAPSAGTAMPPPSRPACGTGQFNNSYTGNCDRR